MPCLVLLWQAPCPFCCPHPRHQASLTQLEAGPGPQLIRSREPTDSQQGKTFSHHFKQAGVKTGISLIKTSQLGCGTGQALRLSHKGLWAETIMEAHSQECSRTTSQSERRGIMQVHVLMVDFLSRCRVKFLAGKGTRVGF